jgi:hypothetical protein
MPHHMIQIHGNIEEKDMKNKLKYQHVGCKDVMSDLW